MVANEFLLDLVRCNIHFFHGNFVCEKIANFGQKLTFQKTKNGKFAVFLEQSRFLAESCDFFFRKFFLP